MQEFLRIDTPDRVHRAHFHRVQRRALDVPDIVTETGDLAFEVPACRLFAAEKCDESTVLLDGDAAEIR